MQLVDSYEKNLISITLLPKVKFMNHLDRRVIDIDIQSKKYAASNFSSESIYKQDPSSEQCRIQLTKEDCMQQQ
jgi:hypothetical protein